MHPAWKALIVFCALVATATLIVTPLLILRVDHAAEDADTRIRTAQFEACQRGNKQLRFVINQRIVRPIETVVSIAATPSGDPAFDVFVPLYQSALDQIAPVPYAICRNSYPRDGSEPHPPFFRDARLPAPLSPEDVAGSDGRAPESDSPAVTGGDASDAPTGSSPPAPGTGGSGTPNPPANPPGNGNPPSPPAEPPQGDPPGLLDPVCDLTGSLGLPLC